MISGLYTAASGLIARMEALDATTNNLANANTTGYKADKPSFESYLASSQQASSGMPLLRESQNTGTRLAGTATDMRPGSLQQTGNSLDVALEGNGFLAVQTPAGVRYTRNGNLSLDSNNRLVTRQGFPVLGDGGPIVITGSQIVINPTGTISVDGTPQSNLQLVEFKDTKGLRKEGDSLFAAPQGTVADPATKTKIKQGYLETSNVNVVKEMIDMVEEGRAAETYQKVIQAMGDVLGKAVNDVGKI